MPPTLIEPIPHFSAARPVFTDAAGREWHLRLTDWLVDNVGDYGIFLADLADGPADELVRYFYRPDHVRKASWLIALLVRHDAEDWGVGSDDFARSIADLPYWLRALRALVVAVGDFYPDSRFAREMRAGGIEW